MFFISRKRFEGEITKKIEQAIKDLRAEALDSFKAVYADLETCQTRTLDLHEANKERVEELAAIYRAYPKQAFYACTQDKLIEDAIKEGYELAYVSKRTGMRTYIKRDR